MRHVGYALGAVLASLVLLSGCGIWGMEGGPGGAGAVGPTVTVTPTAVPAALGPDGVQRIDIRAGDDLRFTPSVVSATVGTIEFTFHNDGLTPHDVRIAAPGPSAATGNLNGGATVTVRITVDKPGVYPFPCIYHSTSGMLGTLQIS